MGAYRLNQEEAHSMRVPRRRRGRLTQGKVT